jgi:hypothetical protein
MFGHETLWERFNQFFRTLKVTQEKTTHPERNSGGFVLLVMQSHLLSMMGLCIDVPSVLKTSNFNPGINPC